MIFGINQIGQGLIFPLPFVDTTESFIRRLPLGQIAPQAGKRTVTQMSSVLAPQAETHQSFGGVATQPGVLDEKVPVDSWMMQSNQAGSLDTLLLETDATDEITLAVHHRRFYSEIAQLPTTDKFAVAS